MNRVVRRPFRYGVAVLAVFVTILLLQLPVVGRVLPGLLISAVFLSALYGGLWPGVVTTTLITAITAVVMYLAQQPGLQATQIAGVTTFFCVGVLFSGLVEAFHAASRRAEDSRLWLAGVLTSIGDSVIATDITGRITFLNRVAESLTGWPQDEALGRPLEDVFVIIHEGTRQPVPSPVRHVLETGAVQGLANHTTLIARDGTERPIADSAAPIRRQDGQLSGVVLVFRDVAERRKDELARERLSEELRANNQRKDEFLAMLAHELRNPLAAVSNAIAVASIAVEREDIEWSIQVAGRQARHLTRLVDDLLDVSRISRGIIDVRRELMDARDAIEQAVETVRPLVKEHQHRFESAIAPGPLIVNADPTRLEQVIANLLTNAAKYTEDGGTIQLRASREGNQVVIEVRDSGVGIAPEKLFAMFELFVQGDRSLDRAEGGLGIGLTLVKKLVELHGGHVVAESEGLGQGSRFVVQLPAASPIAENARPPDGPDEAPTADTNTETGTEMSEPRRTRVLVVDDNVDTATSLALLLTLNGHDVITAFSGPEAISAFHAQAPTHVLLDIGLPGMDGYEVASRLRRDSAGQENGPVLVAISGYGQDADRQRSREAGFDHHLVKPIVDYSDLLTILATPGPTITHSHVL